MAHELKNQGFGEHGITAIMGHTTKSMSMEYYGKRYTFKVLKGVIEKLKDEIN